MEETINVCAVLLGKPEVKNTRLGGNLDIDRVIILECILKKWDMRIHLAYIRSQLW
jgi:hypothetical protein